MISLIYKSHTMKKVIYLITFALAISFTMQAQVAGNTNTLSFYGDRLVTENNVVFNRGDYVLCSNDPSIQITTGTIEAWIKVPVSGAGSGFHGIVVKQIAYGLLLDNNILIAYDWSTQYCVPTIGGEYATTRNLADGNWHHVAMSFRSGVTNGSFIYVDGAIELNFTYNVCIPTGHNLTIGTGSTAGSEQFFKGQIDEVRIWNVVRTQSQIQTAMTSELVGTQTGLVNYFKFDQGISAGDNKGLSTLNDAISPSNNGTLNNFTLTGNTSNWLASNTILPVELISFKAAPLSHAVKLNWQTVNEVNNKGFYIERFDALNNSWDARGFVSAQHKASTYEYVDEIPESERSVRYYRLRQSDNDGYETLSKVVSVALKGAKGMKIYPSIVTDGLLNLATSNTEGDDFAIYNLLGQVVQKGKTTQQVNVSALPNGTYVFKVGTEQAKFLKQ